MKVIKTVLLLLSVAACVRTNIYKQMDKTEESPEQQAVAALTRGDADEAERILRNEVDDSVLKALESRNSQALAGALLAASAHQKAKTIPLLAAAYAAKQNVEVIDLLANVDEKSSDNEAGEATMASILKALPKDAVKAEDDIRRARDLAVGLVTSGANTDRTTALTAVSYTLADYGNCMRKVTNGQNSLKLSQEKAAKVSNADIDNLYYDLQVAVKLSAEMAKVDPKAGKLGSNARKELAGITAASGADHYEKFRHYMASAN